MASQLLRQRSRVVAYLPSLRAAVRHFRAFSSYDEQVPKGYVVLDAHQDGQSHWPDSKLGPLNPRDKKFPLPGNVGTQLTPPPLTIPQAIGDKADLFTGETPQERQVSVLQHFNYASQEITKQELGEDNKPSPLDSLECVAQTCPDLLKKDFQELFPGRSLQFEPLTVISVSQKTMYDMTGWSREVEEERETLLEHFVIGAQEICNALIDGGYWADFIDPSSGRPYLGDFTNATMFETDERYRHFGFEINDLGCCKVISHHLWGTHSYVGCLFTNAPLSHPVLQHLAVHQSGTDTEDEF